MTTNQILNDLLKQVCSLTGNHNNRADALLNNKEEYLALDNYPMYGGYNLVAINCTSGGHSSFTSFPSCGSRVNGKTMIVMLRVFIGGLKYSKTNSINY